MPDANMTFWSMISGGISGLGLTLLAVFGVKERVNNLEKNKVSKEVFREYQIAQKNDHADIKNAVNKIFDKIEAIHKDMPKRNGDTK